MNKITICLLIDAFGWEIKSLSSLYDKFNANKLQTILGFSSSAIPTILTGSSPSIHGRWNLLYRSPQTSPFSWTKSLNLLPRPIIEHRVSRKLINELSKRLCGADGYFSSYGVPARHLHMYDVCEKYNIYRPGGIPGCTTIIDYLAESGVPHHVYSYHDSPDEVILRDIQKLCLVEDTKIYFAYLSELDAFLHKHCGENDLVKTKIDWYAARINDIVTSVNRAGREIRLFIFSDHGMTPVNAHYDLVKDLQTAGIDLEKDCMAAFDSTMARFWVSSGTVRERIIAVLDACNAGDILSDDELQRMGVYFSDHRYGDIIFLMRPGTLIFPNWFGTYAPKGMHGFHPDDAHSFGVYMSNVDDYSPHSILDLYDIMKREIDLHKE